MLLAVGVDRRQPGAVLVDWMRGPAALAVEGDPHASRGVLHALAAQIDHLPDGPPVQVARGVHPRHAGPDLDTLLDAQPDPLSDGVCAESSLTPVVVCWSPTPEQAARISELCAAGRLRALVGGRVPGASWTFHAEPGGRLLAPGLHLDLESAALPRAIARTIRRDRRQPPAGTAVLRPGPAARATVPADAVPGPRTEAAPPQDARAEGRGTRWSRPNRPTPKRTSRPITQLISTRTSRSPPRVGPGPEPRVGPGSGTGPRPVSALLCGSVQWPRRRRSHRRDGREGRNSRSARECRDGPGQPRRLRGRRRSRRTRSRRAAVAVRRHLRRIRHDKRTDFFAAVRLFVSVAESDVMLDVSGTTTARAVAVRLAEMGHATGPQGAELFLGDLPLPAELPLAAAGVRDGARLGLGAPAPGTGVRTGPGARSCRRLRGPPTASGCRAAPGRAAARGRARRGPGMAAAARYVHGGPGARQRGAAGGP
ncbi:hypothetical protein SAZ11_51290 [Streptomyces sp. FXJ1.4098]|nr:hypothetical protein [Streptomyces sp. FXJ1.4098]